MILLNFIKERISELKSSELLLLCLILNIVNIFLIRYWDTMKNNFIITILAGLYFFTVILLTIYVVYLGITFNK